jgi:hypothetical protein
MSVLPPTLEEINDLFVRWLHRSDNQEPQTLPLVNMGKIDDVKQSVEDSITFNAQDEGTTRLVIWDAVNMIVQQLAGHPEYDQNTGATYPWSITSEVNAHTDEATIILQGDLNDHQAATVDAINTHTTTENEEAAAHLDTVTASIIANVVQVAPDVNAHTDEAVVLLQGDMNDHTAVITANTDAIVPQINDHTDEALLLLQGDLNDHEESTVARINSHVDDVFAGSGLDPNSIIGPINSHADDIAAALGGQVAGIPPAVNSHTDAVAALINSHTDLLLSPINSHTTSEADRVITQVNAHIDTAGIGVVLDPTTLVEPINSHTDQVGNFINAHTDQQTVAIPTISAGVAEIRIGIIAILQDLAEALTILGAVAAGISVLRDWLKPFLPGQRTPEQTGEAEWDTMLLFNTAADYYEVEVNLWPQDQQGQVDIGPGYWLPRVAWCAPIAGGFFKERVFLDFTSNVVDVATRVADGLLIYAKPGTRGTVRAYRWT